MIESDVIDCLIALVKVANEDHDGHFTIMKFTTNWRVGFGTPYDRYDIDDMVEGKSLVEAATACLKKEKKRKVPIKKQLKDLVNERYREFLSYHEARRTHAWLLRAEGITYKEIARRIGVSSYRALQMVKTFGGEKSRKMKTRKVKFRIIK
jgi:hypothetical protein